MAPNKAGRVPNTRGLGSDTTPHHHLRQVKVWRSQIYRSWSRLWSGIKRIVQTGKSWFSFMRRPVGEISISYPIYHIYSYLLHITYQCSRFYIYIYISCIPCSSFGPNASCFNITRINSPVTWHLIIGAAHQGLMEMWKANYPSDIQDLEHCMTATPRREDVDKFIIRKAVDASKRG